MRLFFAGGLNEQQNPSLLECISGRNFELGLRQSKLVPRSPYDLSGTATNASPINGLLQLVKRDNTETTLVQAGDTVYLWDGTTGFTSKGTVNSSSRLRDCYWSLGDYLVVVDTAKATVVKKWDGTTFSTLTTGLGTDLYAKYAVVHQNRVWLANVKTTTDTPHLIVASKLDDPTDYDTSIRGGPTTEGGGTFSVGTEAFYLLSPDLKPINGMVSFFGNLVISTTGGRLYQLTGTSASTYKFVPYYSGSAAIGTESMANIGNDLIYMKEGGGIDLLSTTQTSGDVAADDVSRWIPTTTEDLTGAITVYDQKKQKVIFFVQDKALVLFKDLLGAELSPWSVYTTQESFAFNTNAAKYMKRPGTQEYTVFFGDEDGRVLDLNGSGNGDAGSQSISVLRKTRFIYDGEGGDKQGGGALNLRRSVLNGVVQYRRFFTAVDLTVEFDWGDEYNVSSSVISMKGAPTGSTGVYYNLTSYYNGSAYYSQGLPYRDKISTQTFSPSGKGPGFFLSVSADTTAQFQVDSVDLM